MYRLRVCKLFRQRICTRFLTLSNLQMQSHVLSTQKFSIPNITSTLDLSSRLAQRDLILPSEFDFALETRARMHKADAPYSPCYPTSGRCFLILCF